MDIQKFFNKSIVIFFAGVLLSVAVETAIEVPSERYTAIFLFFAFLFVLYATVAFGAVHQRINFNLDKMNLITTMMYEPASGDSKPTYEEAKRLVLSAKYRLLIISQYNPVDAPVGFPQKRKKYLEEGIESVLEQALKAPRERVFEYRRIIQCTNPQSSMNKINETLAKNDPYIFQHCKKVLDMRHDNFNSNVRIKFKVSEPIPSLPSILIIDDKYVLLGIPTRPASKKSQSRPIGTVIVGALFMEDQTGETVRKFRQIFEDCWEDENSYQVVCTNTQT